MNIQNKIRKLLLALQLKNKFYLFCKEQFLSTTTKKIRTVNKLYHLMPIEEYNRLYPDAKKDPNKYSYVRIEILSTFRIEEVLIKLADIYKEVGEANE